MRSVYGDETSSLRVWRVATTFPQKHLVRFLKRFFYMYLLRDFNVGSIETICGLIALGFGAIYGTVKWVSFSEAGAATPAGAVMLSALPIILGFQLLLSAVSFDIANRPKFPLQSIARPNN